MGSKKLTEQDMKEFIESNKYVYYGTEKRRNSNGRKDNWVFISCGKHNSYWVRFYHFKKGQRCHQCDVENKTMWNKDNITEFFTLHNYTIICFEGDIQGNNTRIKVQCDKNHEPYFVTFANFYAGKRCAECVGNKQHTFDYVKSAIESSGEYILLSDNYQNNRQHLEVKCLYHDYTYKVTYANWQSGVRCKLCSNDRLSADRRKDFDVLKSEIESSGQFKLLSDKNDYINYTSDLEIYCTYCNNKFLDAYKDFRKRGNCKMCESRLKYLNYTDEELLNLIIDLSSVLHRNPYVGDVKNQPNLPSLTTYFTRFNTTSWHDILTIAGLKQDMTDEFAKQEFYRWMNEYGHIPYKDDMTNQDGYPNTQDYFDFYNTDKWANILRIMNVRRPPVLGKRRSYKYDDYTIADCISIVQKVFNENPNATKSDVDKYLSSDTIMRKLGSKKWVDVLRVSEVKEYGNERCYDELDALKRLNKYISELGYLPSTEQWNKEMGRPYSSYFSKHFGSWENAIITSGVDIKQNMKDYLVNIYQDTKHSPTRNQLKLKDGSFYCYTQYLKIFNVPSWNDVLKVCGLPINWRSYTDQEILKTLQHLYKQHGKILTREEFNDIASFNHGLLYDRFGSADEAWYLIGAIKKPLSQEERLEVSILELKELAKKIGRIPTTEEYDLNINRGYGRKTLSDVLHMTFSEICCKHLDYTYDNNLKFGAFVFDKKGFLCRSISEQKLSNFFYDNNIEYDKEIKYNDFCDEMSRYIADYKIYNKYEKTWYYVEYFGLYDYKNKYKHIINYTLRTKKKIKFITKYGDVDKCIFLFPKEFKTKPLEEIFKRFL